MDIFWASTAAAATNPNIKVGAKMDAMDLIWHAAFISKLVLVLLAIFSVMSWAIILMKHIQISRIKVADGRFLDGFVKATSLDQIFGQLPSFTASPLAQVFKAGYMELQRVAESRLRNKTKDEGILAGNDLDNISRALRKASDSEISKLESRVTFLATVGSTSPFIGLFGTVWGIMDSFQNIGSTGAASLAVVAPGISEALIATAVGLGAAIPAVMGYNYFVSQFKKQDLEISNFTTDFLNIIKRNFFKD